MRLFTGFLRLPKIALWYNQLLWSILGTLGEKVSTYATLQRSAYAIITQATTSASLYLSDEENSLPPAELAPLKSWQGVTFKLWQHE